MAWQREKDRSGEVIKLKRRFLNMTHKWQNEQMQAKRTHFQKSSNFNAMNTTHSAATLSFSLSHSRHSLSAFLFT